MGQSIERIVVGIDPSLTGTGIARLHLHPTMPPVCDLSTAGTGPAGPSIGSRSARLRGLTDKIYREVTALRPDLILIEGPSFSSKEGHAHDRAGLWWLLAARIDGAGIPIEEVPPTVLKKYATGSGGAAKDHVLAAMIRRHLDFEIASNDQADALALACIAAQALGRPIDDLPRAQLAALRKLPWLAGYGWKERNEEE